MVPYGEITDLVLPPCRALSFVLQRPLYDDFGANLPVAKNKHRGWFFSRLVMVGLQTLLQSIAFIAINTDHLVQNTTHVSGTSGAKHLEIRADLRNVFK